MPGTVSGIPMGLKTSPVDKLAGRAYNVSCPIHTHNDWRLQMSHHIDETLGRPAFVFNATDGEAWHGLGSAIPAEFAKDPAKIAELAGAGYTVSKRPVSFLGANGKPIAVPNREAIVRDDTEEALEVLSGNKYHVVQPVEYFESFRYSLAANDLRISSAGVLKGGRIVFVCAAFEDKGFDVLGVDRVNTYVVMGGGYDGTMASFGYLSSMRTVCWNTLSANIAATKAGKNLFRFPHTAPFDGAALGTALGLGGKELAVRAEVFNTMAGRKMQQAAVAKFFADTLQIKDVEKVTGRVKAQLDALASAYLTGPGASLPTAQGTVWGALNAVTYYVDHLASSRDSYDDGAGAARFASAKFGTGAATKQRALELAMAAAGVEEAMLQAA